MLYNLINEKVFSKTSENSKNWILSVLSVLGLCLMAQVKIPLAFTPVPLTGQTLAVALIALNLPRNFAIGSMLSYLLLGIVGLPVFANASAFLSGPSSGYLVGMMFAVIAVSHLKDKINEKTFAKRLALCYLGSFITLSIGALGLSLYVGYKAALVMGVIPFLAGDLIKNLIAASLSQRN